MKKYLNKILFLVIGLTLATTASYLNAWSGPTSEQDIVNGVPEGNVEAPVNLSVSPQVKLGGLSVASLLSTGAIGASQYCDAFGQNCSTPPFGGSSVPAGTVAAFNLTTCPAGWIPADGTNGTRDLRGVFIRGMESFNGGTTSSTNDPDRSGSNTLGSYQADMYASHSHFTSGIGASTAVRNDQQAVTVSSPGYGLTSAANGGNETRPKNVTLLFCQKDGTSSGGGSSSDEMSSFKSANNISSFPTYISCTQNGNIYALRLGGIENNRVSYWAWQAGGFASYNRDGTNYSPGAYGYSCPASVF